MIEGYFFPQTRGGGPEGYRDSGNVGHSGNPNPSAFAFTPEGILSLQSELGGSLTPSSLQLEDYIQRISNTEVPMTPEEMQQTIANYNKLVEESNQFGPPPSAINPTFENPTGNPVDFDKRRPFPEFDPWAPGRRITYPYLPPWLFLDQGGGGEPPANNTDNTDGASDGSEDQTGTPEGEGVLTEEQEKQAVDDFTKRIKAEGGEVTEEDKKGFLDWLRGNWKAWKLRTGRELDSNSILDILFPRGGGIGGLRIFPWNWRKKKNKEDPTGTGGEQAGEGGEQPGGEQPGGEQPGGEGQQTQYPELKTGKEVYEHVKGNKDTKGLSPEQIEMARGYGSTLPKGSIPLWLLSLLGLAAAGSDTDTPPPSSLQESAARRSMEVYGNADLFDPFGPSILQTIDPRLRNSRTFMPEGEVPDFNLGYRGVPGQMYANYQGSGFGGTAGPMGGIASMQPLATDGAFPPLPPQQNYVPIGPPGGMPPGGMPFNPFNPFNPYGQMMMAADGGFSRKNGQISGPGTETSDDIPAMLSDGEFVVNAKAVRGIGNLLGRKKPKSKQEERLEGARMMYALQRAGEQAARIS